MAVTIEGSFTVPAAKALVWVKLLDPEVLKGCITGCRTFERISDMAYIATGGMKVGPIRVSVKGKITLFDIDAPNCCRVVGEGQGGLAGFAKGTAAIRLNDVPDGTAVAYTLDVDVGGRLARLGAPLIKSVTQRVAGQFLAAFATAVAPIEFAGDRR